MPARTPTTGTAFAQLSVGDILIFGVDWIQRIFKIGSKWTSVHFFFFFFKKIDHFVQLTALISSGF